MMTITCRHGLLWSVSTTRMTNPSIVAQSKSMFTSCTTTVCQDTIQIHCFKYDRNYAVYNYESFQEDGDLDSESDGAVSFKSAGGGFGAESPDFSLLFIPSCSTVSNTGVFSLVTDDVSGVVGGVSTSSKDGQLL